MGEVARLIYCPYSLLRKPLLVHVVHGGKQHASVVTGRVVDGIGFFAIQKAMERNRGPLWEGFFYAAYCLFAL